MAVIGTGWWATRAHLPALVAAPDAEIVALVDPDVDKLKCAARAFGVSRGYPDVGSLLESDAIDAAVVAVPHSRALEGPRDRDAREGEEVGQALPPRDGRDSRGP